MEADELKSDLYALRQLYGLLQRIIGCGDPNISPQNVCESLDKRAIQIMKNLLDNATQQKLSEMRIQATTRKPKPYLSPQIIDPSKQLIVHSNIISDQKISIDNNHNNYNYKLEEADFDSSSTGFSTPTFNDHDSHIIDHVVFSNQVSKAIEEIGSNISALRMEENSGAKFFSDHNSAPRIPSTKIRATSTDFNNTNRPMIVGPTLVAHENCVRNQQLVSEPESSSYDDEDDDDDDQSEGFYENSSEESSANIPSESSYNDDDYVGSSSGINSASYSSSYGTAKSETNPNYYVLRRKVQDYSEKAARVSTLRRIKDKLGLIFHHHHHHHHHHNYPHEPRDRWKPFDDHDNKDKRNSNYPNRNDENNAFTRRRSTARRSGTSTNFRARRTGGGGGGSGDLGNFRALVEALTRHVRGGGDRKKLAAVKVSGGGGGGGGGWRQRLGRDRGVRINDNGNYGKRRVKAGFNNRANTKLAKLRL